MDALDSDWEEKRQHMVAEHQSKMLELDASATKRLDDAKELEEAIGFLSSLLGSRCRSICGN